MEYSLSRELSHDVLQKEKKIGIMREWKNNKIFRYYYIKNGQDVTKKDLTRIESLHIPPAWMDVWISEDPSAPIQAIGMDDKGRKQYRYNDIHNQTVEKEKFLRLYNFIKAIPKLEEVINKHSTLHSYDKNKVIATMLFLVKKLYIRAGKEQYARENKSYGISSLKKKHVKIESNTIKLNFKGKSHQRVSYTYTNPEIANHIKELLKLQGEKLFQYIDKETGKIRKVTDSDLNQYIQEWMGQEFTVKDFRTYAANFHFIKELLKESKLNPTEKRIKKGILHAIKKTAIALRHTKAISKKSYVMNFTIDLFSQNHKFFYENKHENPNDILLAVLKLYKKEILKL